MLRRGEEGKLTEGNEGNEILGARAGSSEESLFPLLSFV
jgi:hypothetical protein